MNYHFLPKTIIDDCWDPFFKALSDKVDAHKKATHTGYKSDEKAVYYEVDLPGFEEKEISVSLKDSQIIINAKKATQDKNISFRKEILEKFSFDEKFVEIDKLEAIYQNGVLRLTLPFKKPEQIKQEERKISIKKI